MTSGIFPEYALLVTNLHAPPGTRIPMNQAAPPLGWTQDTTTAMNDCSMRVIASAGGGAGGSTAWSAWNFGGTFGVNAFTISTAQMPVHNHGISDPGHGHGFTDVGHNHGINDPGHGHGVGDPGHTHSIAYNGGGGSPNGFGGPISGASGAFSSDVAATCNISIGASGSNISNQASGSGITAINAAVSNITTVNNGSGAAIGPTYTTPQVKYTDHIMAVKS